MGLRQTDRKYLMRDEEPEDLAVARSHGSFLIDAKGKKYIDFYVGWCVGNLGWGNKEIEKKIKNFRGPNYVSPSFLYKPWIELAELLAKITPGKLKKCFRATGGTEAVEIALCVANAYTKRHKFISIAGSYHGNSIGAMSVGSASFRKKHPGLLFSTYKIKPPLDNKAAERVERRLKKRDIAALIMEPIILNLGVLIPQQEFMTRIQKACKKYGTLLIMDEVATGFGRTGKLFATEHYNIEPDIMTMAKAITGGYAGMGATIITEKIAKAIGYESSYWSTYGWHPLSVAAALANIKYLLKHQKKIAENTAAMSQYFRSRLVRMKFKYAPEIRIKGLAIAVKFKQANYADKIVERCFRKGILLSSTNRGFTFFPALTIDRKTAKKGLDILENCL